MSYHLSKKIPGTFTQAIEKVTEELRKEGFGIITTIDLRETFKKKIDVDFRKYTILGACNPRFAYEALLTEDRIGVFLPCNVVVQQHENDEVEISIINPEELMNGMHDLNLQTFATEIRAAMQNVLNRL
jgi:uncharacterized protein (DUF302 family)